MVDGKAQYDRCVAYLDEVRNDLAGDSPHLLVDAGIHIQGLAFRVGQVIAEMEIFHSKTFIDYKKGTSATDRDATHYASVETFNKYGVSLKSLELLYKDFDKLRMQINKKVSLLASEMQGA